MNKLSTTRQENHRTLKNIQKVDKFQELLDDFDSTQLLTCIKDHVAVSRSILEGKTIGTSFSAKFFRKGDIVRRNKIVLNPEYWSIKE